MSGSFGANRKKACGPSPNPELLEIVIKLRAISLVMKIVINRIALPLYKEYIPVLDSCNDNLCPCYYDYYPIAQR